MSYHSGWLSLITHVGGVMRRLTKSIHDVGMGCLKAFVPVRVIHMWHVQDNAAIEHMYHGLAHGFSWSGNFSTNMFAPYSGFYLFTACNVSSNFLDHFYLSADQLNNALQTKRLSTLWALSDFGLCTLLTSHYLAQKPDVMRIFAIMIHGEDVTATLKPYMRSIVLTNNLTAQALCELYAFATGTDKKKYEDEVVLVDYDLEEKVIRGDELLFPH